MAQERLYKIIGLACGFILIDYGFSLLAAGFPGLRPLTSQIIGANMLIGGSVAVFLSMFYLLKPPTLATPSTPLTQEMGQKPDIGIGLVVEEVPPSQYGFYKNIQYVGYLFTGLGLFAAVDLVLQVLVPGFYNETRWWVEILLATFGVLSYAIFGSIGRLGAQEERQYVPAAPSPTPTTEAAPHKVPQAAPTVSGEVLQLRVSEFSQSNPGEYERKLSGTVYDMFRVDLGVITVWRENRLGIRSAYLAGPYELSSELLQKHADREEELRIGYLSLSVDTLRDLLRLQQRPVEGLQAPTS
jgi:hypothetical protein